MKLGEKLRHLPWLGIFLVAACLLVGFNIVIWYGWELVLSHHKKTQELGQFADFFGGLMNPLVALCALIGIWYSVALQKRELAELRKGQNEQVIQQRFFDLLRLYQQTLDSVVVFDKDGSGSIIASGKTAIHFFMNGSTKRFDIFRCIIKGENYKSRVDYHRQPDLYWHWENNASWMSHYFKIIFLTINEIDQNFQKSNQKYLNFFFAQLSTDEIRLIFLHIIFDVKNSATNNDLKKLTIKYNLIQHLPSEPLYRYLIDNCPEFLDVAE